jgi:hypothetical protein
MNRCFKIGVNVDATCVIARALPSRTYFFFEDFFCKNVYVKILDIFPSGSRLLFYSAVIKSTEVLSALLVLSIPLLSISNTHFVRQRSGQ